jgi:hypothetical protein
VGTSCLADNLLVPAYFYPGTGGPGGTGDGWAAMATAAGQVPLTAILNPNSGPGPSADPNYVNAITNLENHGGKVVAYVPTLFGGRLLTSVESDINKYISEYGSQIDGFFIDQMSVTTGTLSYYQSLDSFIKGLSASYQVIGNPGQPFLSSGVTAAQYLSTADVLNIFEGDNTAFAAYPSGQTWYQSFASSRFSNIIFNVPGSSLLADINRAESLNAGSVYITDQTLPNPYDQLPSYWDQEVSALAAQDSVPEAGSLTLLALGGLVVIPFGLKRRA